MKYQHWEEDLLALKALVDSGKVDYTEAAEMREYLESLAI